MWNIDWLQELYSFGPRIHLRALQMQASDYMKTRVYHGLIDNAYGPYIISLIYWASAGVAGPIAGMGPS